MARAVTPAPQSQPLHGFVRKVLQGRCGFIRTDDHTDYFFHANDVVDCPLDRNRVPHATPLLGKTVQFFPAVNERKRGKLDRAVRVKEV